MLRHVLLMRLTAILGILGLTVVACTQAPIAGDNLQGHNDDTPSKKSSKKKTPAPTTDTPAPGDSPAPPPAPTAEQPPTLTSVAPDSVTVGSSADGLDVTLSGTKFPNNVQVNLGTDKIPATFVSPEQLKVHIPGDKIKTTGMLRLTVVAKAGVESNALTFTVANPTSTTIQTLLPANVIVGTTDPVALKVTGSGFTAQSVVKFNGAALPTTFTSSSELSASVPATALTDAGRVSVTVALGTDVMSLPFAFEVRNPSPTASSLSPNTVPSGAAATITVNGTGFTKGSSVLAGGQAVSTTFVSATQLRAVVPANALSASGNVNLNVQNGQPGGGTSNNVALSISTTGTSSSGGTQQGANPNCAYQCSDYGYAPGQCYANYYCITSGTYAGCLGQADCGDVSNGAAGGNNGAAGNNGGAAGGNNGAGAASCTYKCADYGYDPGECYADWTCLSSGTYAGCLAQTLCDP